MDYLSKDAAMHEVKQYLSSNGALDYDLVINFVHPYFDLIAKEDYKPFKEDVLKALQTDYANLFSYPSDMIRVTRELEKIAHLHGQMRIFKNARGSYEMVTLVKSPKVTRPIVAPVVRQGVVKMDDEFTYELKYQKDVKTALLENSIDEYLEAFKNTAIDGKDYAVAVMALKSFFEGNPPSKPKCCSVKNRNKKKLGYALGRLYSGQVKSSLSFEYLDFCRRLFDCYKDEMIDATAPYNSNLHKYFTTKSQ